MTAVKQTSLHSAHQRKTKMARICVAHCWSGQLCACACMLLYWLTFLTQQVASLLSYDRDQLLLIKSTVDETLVIDYIGTSYCPPPVLTNVPDHLWHSPYNALHKKRYRKRGCCGGIVVKSITLLATNRRSLRQTATLCQAASPDRSAFQRGLEGSGGWIQPPRCRGRGVDHTNLRYLHREQPLIKESTPIELVLINTRSLVNKTFIQHDFTTMNKLDFFFISKTWLKEGDC